MADEAMKFPLSLSLSLSRSGQLFNRVKSRFSFPPACSYLPVRAQVVPPAAEGSAARQGSAPLENENRFAVVFVASRSENEVSKVTKDRKIVSKV